MTRGLSLIKLHFVNIMHNNTAEQMPKVTGLLTKSRPDLSSSAYQTVLYVQVAALAPQLQELVKEIEMRCENHPEYTSLLRDCFNSFFNARKQLLGPVVSKEVEILAQTNTNVLSLV